MTSFRQPKPGEKQDEFQARREEMIAFVMVRHAWPRARTVEFLESLNHVGIAYIGVDMKEAARNDRKRANAYDPYSELFLDALGNLIRA